MSLSFFDLRSDGMAGEVCEHVWSEKYVVNRVIV